MRNDLGKSARVLVVDDEETIRKLLQARFSREGWTVDTAEDGKHALEVAGKNAPTVIVTDVKMPGLDGFQLMDALKEAKLDCPVIVITGHGEKECAIEAIHHGAFDYLEKPFDMDEIAHVVKRAIEREALRKDNLRLVAQLESQLEVKTELLERVIHADDGEELLVGDSDHIQSLKQMVRAIAENFKGKDDPVVLITGESGVGKEVVAKYMHEVSFGKDKPFVAVNCAAFPDHLLESELFGFEKGAFTGAVNRKLGLFELASGGTLFLDEIGEMDLKMQAKLLRVLQERVIRRLGGTNDIAVRPHIITATNRDLAREVTAKTFREDLYYRLNTIPIAVAPLRSRPSDILALASFFLKKITTGRNKRFTGFSPNALKALQSYGWPGNVRELRSVIERAVILEKGPQIELSHLRQEHLHVARIQSKGELPAPTNGGDRPENVVEFQPAQNGVSSELMKKGLTGLRKEMDERFVRQVLVQALTREQGNVSAVARQLRLDRANLLRMLKRFAIEPELFRQSRAS